MGRDALRLHSLAYGTSGLNADSADAKALPNPGAGGLEGGGASG